MFVDRTRTGIGISLGDNGANPFVDLTKLGRWGAGLLTAKGESMGGRACRMRLASSGVKSGACFIVFDIC